MYALVADILNSGLGRLLEIPVGGQTTWSSLAVRWSPAHLWRLPHSFPFS